MSGSESAAREQRLELVARCLAGLAEQSELVELQTLLERDPQFRVEYVRYVHLHSGLSVATEAVGAAAHELSVVQRAADVSGAAGVGSVRTGLWRRGVTVYAVVLGFLIGLIGTSWAWSTSESRLMAVVEPIQGFVDGQFELSTHESATGLRSGFPRSVSCWGGDPATVVQLALVNRGEDRPGWHRCLRFMSPGGDAATPAGPATSCDIFQVVDLRSLQGQFPARWDGTLELSAEFLDVRPARERPDLSVYCQMFVFRGIPEEMYRYWPEQNGSALASAAAWHRSVGATDGLPVRLSARCLLPEGADFVVVQLAARPDSAATVLDGVFADNVSLRLRLQPQLPERAASQGRLLQAGN